MKFRNVLGIDFGGSGIKGAPVDTKKGVLLDKRFRLPTPVPASPGVVIEVIQEIVDHFKWSGAVGLTFPAVIQNGIIKTAANIDKSWIGINGEALVSEKIGLPTVIVNDADAAGMAEMKFGAGKGRKGLVIIVTIGTGIGSSLFSRKKLIPNTEFGHIYLSTGVDAEIVTSDAARKKEKLEWDEWAKRFDIYLHEIERLLYPELIIIGGGISRKDERFLDFLTVKAECTIAELKNDAGLIGAAIAARASRDRLSLI
jgi:polyphosphate glucokinase